MGEPMCGNVDGLGAKFDCDGNPDSSPDVYKIGAAAEISVNAATCCEEPNCFNTDGADTAFVCSGGQSVKPNPETISSPTEGNCCFTPTCANTDGADTKFACAGGKVFKTSAASDAVVNGDTCCEESPNRLRHQPANGEEEEAVSGCFSPAATGVTFLSLLAFQF